jgi:hypothetical protein
MVGWWAVPTGVLFIVVEWSVGLETGFLLGGGGQPKPRRRNPVSGCRDALDSVAVSPGTGNETRSLGATVP